MDTCLFLLAFLFFSTCHSKTAMHTQNNPAFLIEAVQNGKLNEVEAALKNGADVNTTDKRKRSLLMLATHAKDLKMGQLLVSYGANVNQQDDIQDSPFLYAGASGYTAFVKLFLENGARFDVYNRYGGTALIPACERGHLETVKLLAFTKNFPIDHVNRLGWTALMETVVLGDGSNKYLEITKTLIAAGCNVNIPDKDGVTALQHARKRNFKAIAEVLEKAVKK